MTSFPDAAAGGDQDTRPTEESRGGPPQGGVELGEDIAKEGQTGISSVDADEHRGEQAPASEGHDPLD